LYAKLLGEFLEQKRTKRINLKVGVNFEWEIHNFSLENTNKALTSVKARRKLCV